jgi:hypothetical protein
VNRFGRQPRRTSSATSTRLVSGRGNRPWGVPARAGRMNRAQMAAGQVPPETRPRVRGGTIGTCPCG